MIDTILIVLLRLVIIIAAFGLLATALLIRALVRRAYALSKRTLSGRNSGLQKYATQPMGRSVGSARAAGRFPTNRHRGLPPRQDQRLAHRPEHFTR